ncbi:MAG: SBBP repeat-containing protein [Waltera sp.]
MPGKSLASDTPAKLTADQSAGIYRTGDSNGNRIR